MKQDMSCDTGRIPRAAGGGRVFALAVVVVLALSCASASSALALTVPEWLLGGKALTAEHAVEWKNQTVTLKYGGLGGLTFEVTCKTSGEGDVYPVELLAKIKITKMTFTSCGTPSGHCQKAKLEGYKTGESPYLIPEGSKVLLEKGLFELGVTCEAGVNEEMKDDCIDSATTLVTNESTGVLASLEGNNLSCADTKEGSSWLHGKITLVATGSSKLSVS
jgi:hypothetical protein